MGSPDVASKRGAKTRLLTRLQGARWRRWSCTRVHAHMASPGVTGRSIRMWRQNVASLAHVASESRVATLDAASGVAGREVNTWRQGPRLPGTCLHNIIQYGMT